MEIVSCSKADFDQICSDIVDFWGSDRTLHLHQPYLVYEFGSSAYVIKEAGQVVAYVFGFLSQTEPVGYEHLLAVRRSHRKRGLARRLHDHFVAFARAAGCREIKAITTPTNSESIAFHRGMGMELLGVPNEEGTPVVKDYSGPGKDRVVFHKRIAVGDARPTEGTPTPEWDEGVRHFLTHWFSGFVDGLERLDEPARKAILHACGKACAESYTAGVFQEAKRESADLDGFLAGLAARFPEATYERLGAQTIRVRYGHCACDLVTRGLIRSPLLCECSVQNLRENLEGALGVPVEVRLEGSILGGAAECAFTVELGQAE